MFRRYLIPAAVLLAAACSDSSGPSGDPVQTNQVSVRDNFFNPGNAQVAAGATVTWTWAGSIVHDLTFEDGQGSSAAKSSGTHARTFGAAGTFRYRCTIHSSSFTSGMTGQIVVQ